MFSLTKKTHLCLWCVVHLDAHKQQEGRSCQLAQAALHMLINPFGFCSKNI